MIRAAAAQLQTILGVEPNTTSHTEKIVSIVGGFAGIFMVMVISSAVLGHVGAALMVASMGASTVLLFAVPHGALSQPWPMVGGNVISAIVGVTVYKFVPDVPIAAPLAVALAIGAMHRCTCLGLSLRRDASIAQCGGTSGYGSTVQFRVSLAPLSHQPQESAHPRRGRIGSDGTERAHHIARGFGVRHAADGSRGRRNRG